MKKLISIISRLLLSLMGLSFASCRVEYGCPHAEFRATGVVTDEEGQPISGIRVVMSADYPNSNVKGPSDTLWTGPDGAYMYAPQDFYASDYPFLDSVKFKFEDVDGEANGGEFSKVEIEVPVFQVEPGDGNWYQGSYQSGVDVTMFRKE